ncbi:FAD-dependent oxidoreductase [soil metagenome]
MTAPRPVILAVDDEPEVLHAVARDLRREYARDYQIASAGGGQEAIEAMDGLALKGTPLALIVADQRMPIITGIDVLKASLQHFPLAKRTLLTAYADTEAAISAINEVGLDQYIMKPWDPPDNLLYPVLNELLEDWQNDYRPTFEAIRVIGQEWSRSAHDLKAFLAMNQIPYRSLVPARDEEADRLMESLGAEVDDLPIVLPLEGEPMFNPDQGALAERLGLRRHANAPAYDLAIVGAGPAGLAAAVYGASEGLRTILLDATAPCGQAGQSSLIENYLGFPKGIKGGDLARRAYSQAARFGAEILVPASVARVERKDPFRLIHLADGSQITAKAMIVTSGVSYRRLQAEGLEELTGAGVYYGTSRIEAQSHLDSPMYVIGGGNSAGQAALFLTGFTDRVSIIIRGEDLGASMSRYLIANIEANKEVSVLPRTQVIAASGDRHLEHLTLQGLVTGEQTQVVAGAVFIFIGQRAQTEWLGDLVQLDDKGFVLSGSDLGPLEGWNVERDPLPLETSVPGIFVAGDVRHGSIRRVAGATGEGATAVRFVHPHLAAL